MANYSRGDEVTLPTNSDDLETIYSAGDLTAVSTDDDSTYVSQTASGQYPIHEFKNVTTATNVDVVWDGKSNYNCATYPVVLQVYKVAAPAAWETLDTDNTTTANNDFTLTGNIPDSTNYRDGSNIVTCRVYQDFTGGAPTVMATNPFANMNTDLDIGLYPDNNSAIGQSFTGNGDKIVSVTLYMYKGGSPTGNCYVKIFAHSGTYGTSSVPNMSSLLATSDAIDMTTLPTGSAQAVSFTFTGAQQYQTTNTTKYVLAFFPATNKAKVGEDTVGSNFDGNVSWDYSTDYTAWSAGATTDLVFIVYGRP